MYLGEAKFKEYIEDGFKLNLLNFTVYTVDGLVADILPLTAAFDMLLDKVQEMLDDIDLGIADLPEIREFLSELK